MTEQEAIESLVGELGLNDEPTQETQAQEPTQETQAQEVPSDLTQQNLQDMISTAMAQVEQKRADEQERAQQAQESEQAKAEQLAKLNSLTPETVQALEQLGLGNIANLGEQVAQLQAQINEQKELAQQRATFDENMNKFKSEFPTIKPDEMGKWAETNGFLNMLGSDYNGWRLVAKAMMNVAKPQEKPDEIIGENGGGSALNAFEKIKKGEQVSDIEIGASLLKQAGIL